MFSYINILQDYFVHPKIKKNAADKIRRFILGQFNAQSTNVLWVLNAQRAGTDIEPNLQLGIRIIKPR